jgi:imidazolonepropionase-like amidohydrolase
MTHRPRLAFAAALILLAGVAAADVTLIHAGELLAVPGKAPAREMTIIVEDDRVTGVQQGYVESEGATVVDLRNKFVLPGLMDMHVHLQGELGPKNDRDALKMSSQLMQMRSLHYAMNTLLAGFTTVRDVGSLEQEMYAMRDAINVCDGPYDCRRAARNVIKYGGDLIKITSTGGVMTQRATGTGQQMEMDELREVVRAAARMGRKVASHAHEEDGIVAALEAGVASIEHGTYTGPRAIRLFKETGAYLVPTLLAGKTVAELAVEAEFMTPEVRVKAIRVGNDMAGNFAKAHKAGVNVAYGTDSGISRHGTNAEEAVLMVEAGMDEMDVIVAATVNAADLIDMSESLGTIEAGKFADIIAVDASPLSDISELLDVDFVMKGGKVYKHMDKQ